MQVADIIQHTQAKVLTESSDHSQIPIDKAFSSDLMSNALTIYTELHDKHEKVQTGYPRNKKRT